jgi:hypothetical protein
MKVARLTVAFVVTAFMLFFTRTAVTVKLIFSDRSGCCIRSEILCNEVYSIIQFLLLIVMASTLMTPFGRLTIGNTNRVRVILSVVSRHRRTKRHLGCIPLLQAGAHTLKCCVSCVTLAERSSNRSDFLPCLFSLLCFIPFPPCHCLYSL